MTSTPTIGITLTAGSTGPGGAGGVRAAGELALAAERAGLDRVWCGEFYTRSATIPLAYVAGRTQRLGIGSSIAYAVGRSPLVLAAEARDLDELSGGRAILGLGTGTRRMMQDWHGVDGDAPAVRMEELIDLLRELWRLHEAPVAHDGRFYRLHLTPAAPVAPPVSQRLPIYTAGVNPRMVEVAGRVADGLLGHPTFTPYYVDGVVRPAIARGAARRDRDPRDIELVGIVMCSVHDDLEVARREVAAGIAFYAATATYKAVFELQGWGEHYTAIRDALRRGDFAAMGKAVTDEMLDTIGIAARPADLRATLNRYAGVYDHVILIPPSFGPTPERTAEITRDIVAALS